VLVWLSGSSLVSINKVALCLVSTQHETDTAVFSTGKIRNLDLPHIGSVVLQCKLVSGSGL